MTLKAINAALCVAAALGLSACGGSKAPAAPKAFEPPSASDDQRAQLNQALANMLESLRASKSIDDDQAKQLQSLLQQMKDADAKSSDYLAAMIDLLRAISRKISS
jgi:predicted lipoprotein